jgi:thiamine-phosphate pyrophosphorylase
MLPEMTEAVSRALATAQLWAQRSGAAEVRTLDLMRGLLEEEEGHAAVLLTEAGVDMSALRASWDHPAPLEVSFSVLPLSQLSQKALESAFSLARELSAEHSVSSECLLLAVLREDVELRQMLAAHGLLFSGLETKLLAEAGPPLLLEQPLVLGEMTEFIDAARVLDASANRAREGLRVLEDYARFCLDDVFLTGQLKQARHDLRDILDNIPDDLLLHARETLRDVGTAISTSSERERHSLRQVATASCKRLEEALRSLEEFSKLLGGDCASRLEQLRYRAYTLERALLLGAPARERLKDCTIQVLLTGSLCSAALDWTIAEAAAGGAHIIQLREKSLADRELVERARNVRRWTHQAGLLLIVNDRPDIARLVEADGVHLGQDDLSVKDARRIVGPDLLVGVSTHSIEEVRQAILDGASYLGVGPTFPSATKDFSDFPGLDFVRQATAETSLPLFVIGGINARTLPAAVEAGARRIAVSSAVCQADEPRQAVAELASLL